jgi:pimeloyl-ACP methyl ester carboxylesterase
LCEPDVEALDGPVAEFLAVGFRRAVEQGIVGWYDDEMAFLRHEWGFDVGATAVPVSVWQGRLDLMTPPAHAEWLLARLPNADAHVVDPEGHVSLVARYLDDIVAGVARHLP